MKKQEKIKVKSYQYLDISPNARKMFDDILASNTENIILTLDYGTLAMYCANMDEASRLMRLLKNPKLTKGERIDYTNQLRACQKNIHVESRNLMLTPYDRKRGRAEILPQTRQPEISTGRKKEKQSREEEQADAAKEYV